MNTRIWQPSKDWYLHWTELVKYPFSSSLVGKCALTDFDLTFVYPSEGFILSKIGEKKAMQIVLFLYALRFGYYSQMTSPWQTVYIEFISGGCQGLFMPAQVQITVSLVHHFPRQSSPPRLVSLMPSPRKVAAPPSWPWPTQCWMVLAWPSAAPWLGSVMKP